MSNYEEHYNSSWEELLANAVHTDYYDVDLNLDFDLVAVNDDDDV
jgi:hypothetical protein